jgi:hypothetical protein
MSEGSKCGRSDASIEIYLREINSVRLLTADEEKALAIQV